VNEERILAIDFGTKRIGLAITDPLKLFAIPYDTIPNDQNTLEKIQQIVTEKYVIKVILGNPVKENGEDSIISKNIRRFKTELEKKINLEIELVDERYSSEIASKRIIESVPSKKKRRNKSLIDKNAAAVILEDYLQGI